MTQQQQQQNLGQFLGGDFDDLADNASIKFKGIVIGVQIQDPPPAEKGEERYDNERLRLCVVVKQTTAKKDGSAAQAQSVWLPISKVKNSQFGIWTKRLRESGVLGYDEAMARVKECGAKNDRDGVEEAYRGLLVGRIFEVEKTDLDFPGIGKAKGVLLLNRFLGEEKFDELLVKYGVNVPHVQDAFKDRGRKKPFPVVQPKIRYSGSASKKANVNAASGSTTNGHTTGGSAAPDTHEEESPDTGMTQDPLIVFLRSHKGGPNGDGKIGATLSTGDAVVALANAGCDADNIVEIKQKALEAKWITQKGPITTLAKDAP